MRVCRPTPAARLGRPTQPAASRPAGTGTKDRCMVEPSRYTATARLLGPSRKGQSPAAEPESSPCQSLVRQQFKLRFQLLDALGQIVDQLTFGIGQRAVFQIIARADSGLHA